MVEQAQLPQIAQSRTNETELSPTDIYTVAADYVGRHRPHKDRIVLYDAIVDGRWNTIWPDGTATQQMPLVSEFISSDTEDLAGLIAGPQPSIVVPQSSDKPKDLENALRREQIVATYRKHNNLKRLRHKTAIDLVSTGLGCWVVWPDFQSMYPRITRRDPRIVYPDPLIDSDEGSVSSVVIRYVTFIRLLAARFPHIIPQLYTELEIRNMNLAASNEQVEVIEFHDAKGSWKIVHRGAKDARYRDRNVQIAHVPNLTGVPFALVAYRESADGRFRGQFDKSIPPLGTADKIMQMHLAQMADSIFAEKIVRGQFDNPEDVGPGAVLYTMDYQASIDRATVANSSYQMYQDVQLLLDQSREAAGIPQGRHGAVDQNIISAQGINALMGKYATTVTSYQGWLAELEQHAYSLALMQDVAYLDIADKQLSGVQGGRSFSGTYTPSVDIAGKYEVMVQWPAGSSMDSYNRSVTAIQKTQYAIISRRKAMEMDDDIEDVAAMEAEIFKERLVDGFVAGLADPQTDLLTRAQALALTLENKTPDEVILAVRDSLLEAQQQAAMDQAAQTALDAQNALPAEEKALAAQAPLQMPALPAGR